MPKLRPVGFFARDPWTSFVPDRWWTLSRGDKIGLSVSALLAIVATVATVVTFITALDVHRETQPLAHGIRTTGVVVAYVDSGGRVPSYTPVVRFFTRSGQSITFRGAASLGKPKVGDSVVVSYRSAQPREARDLSEGSGSWEGFAAFALLLALVAVASFYSVRRVLHRK